MNNAQKAEAIRAKLAKLDEQIAKLMSQRVTLEEKLAELL